MASIKVLLYCIALVEIASAATEIEPAPVALAVDSALTLTITPTISAIQTITISLDAVKLGDATTTVDAITDIAAVADAVDGVTVTADTGAGTYTVEITAVKASFTKVTYTSTVTTENKEYVFNIPKCAEPGDTIVFDSATTDACTSETFNNQGCTTTFQCAENHIANGANLEASCPKNAAPTWDLPVCVKGCKTFEGVETPTGQGSNADGACNHFMAGCETTFVCSAKYIPSGTDLTRKCKDDGSGWDTDDNPCKKRCLVDVNWTEVSKVIEGTTTSCDTEANCKFTFTCKNNTPKTEHVRICQASGEWDDETNPCGCKLLQASLLSVLLAFLSTKIIS